MSSRKDFSTNPAGCAVAAGLESRLLPGEFVYSGWLSICGRLCGVGTIHECGKIQPPHEYTNGWLQTSQPGLAALAGQNPLSGTAVKIRAPVAAPDTEGLGDALCMPGVHRLGQRMLCEPTRI